MNLRQVDLNLLVALDVLLTERNVTRDQQVEIELAKVHGAPGSVLATRNPR